MREQTAYEAYRESLHSRTRNWHELRKSAEHKDKSDEVFDTWLKENQSDSLSRYFMGDYDAMPEHTKAGWAAFAENAANGPEEAWNSYANAARSNFHKDKGILLPRYDAIDPDQQAAVQHAVERVLELSSAHRP